MLTSPAGPDRLYVRLFWCWLIGRTAIWTLVSWLTLSNPPQDTVEMLSWGPHWLWCYYKHPPMPAWIAEAAAELSGNSIGAVYLASHLVIALCMWSAWTLGREMLSPRLGFLAALCLEPLDYYNRMANDMGHGVALAGASAVLTVCCHRAITRGGWHRWAALGLAAGGAFLSKYSAVFLFIPMILFVAAHPRCRPLWKRPGPYLALGVASLVVLPHLIRCAQADFGPVRYFVGRSYEKESSLLNHLWFPVAFLGGQAWRLVFVILVLVPLVWPWRWRVVPAGERFNRDFLLAMAAGPVVLHVLVAGVLAVEVRELWGHHLWTFLGVFVLFFFQATVTPRRLAAAGLLALLGTAGFMAYFVVTNLNGPGFGHVAQTHLPGRAVAAQVAREWAASHAGPIPIIASDDMFLGCSVCWYSAGRPASCCLVGDNETPWATDDDLNRQGGVIVWLAWSDDPRLPEPYRNRFPTAQPRPLVEVPINRGATLPPRRFGIAIVPAAGK